MRAIQILNKRDRKKILLVIALQLFFSLLDLIGVGVIGVIGALAIRGVSSKRPGDKVEKILNFLGLANQSLQTQVAILGVLAVSMLVTKTIFSAIFTRRLVHFLSSRSAQISADLFSSTSKSEPHQNTECTYSGSNLLNNHWCRKFVDWSNKQYH